MQDKLILKNFFKYIFKYKLQVLALPIVMLCLLGFSIIKTFIWGKLTSSIFSGSLKMFTLCIFILLINLIFMVIFQLLQSKLSLYLKVNLIYSMQKDFYNKMLDLNLLYINSLPNKGTFITKITSDISQCVETFILQFLPAMSSAVSLIVLFYTMFRINLVLSILTLSTLPIVMCIYIKKSKKLRIQQEVVRSKKDAVSSKILQATNYVKSIKMLGIKEYNSLEFERNISDYKNEENKYGTLMIYFSAMGITLTSIIEFLIFSIGGIMTIKKHIGVDSFISFTGFYQQFYTHCNKVLNLIPSYQKIIVLLRRISSTIDSDLGNYDNFGENEIEKINSLEINNVSFSYKEKQVLSNVNIKFDKNGIFGIIGESGVGKSTLINLLSNIYVPDKGTILVNGRNITEFKEKSLRQKIAVVSQEHFIFKGSIKQNFLSINENLTDGEIIFYCKECGIHQFIDSLPEKYNSIIDENLTNLSEGQKQRIALARALSTGSQILILDEPVSSLDQNSSEIIKNTLEKIRDDKIIIIISHNYNILENADIVYEIAERKVEVKYDNRVKEC